MPQKSFLGAFLPKFSYLKKFSQMRLSAGITAALHSFIWCEMNLCEEAAAQDLSWTGRPERAEQDWGGCKPHAGLLLNPGCSSHHHGSFILVLIEILKSTLVLKFKRILPAVKSSVKTALPGCGWGFTDDPTSLLSLCVWCSVDRSSKMESLALLCC